MKRKIKFSVVFLVLLAVFLLLLGNTVIEYSAKNKTFTEVSKIDKNRVGLVLGTSKRRANGQINRYFKYRIKATVDLYNAGKIDFILVSGDNSNAFYDEPTDFKNELIKNGIPEHKIFLDFAGFRTLDSVVRAKHIFGQDRITIISQKFHNERAIFIAQRQGIDAIGYNAKDVSLKGGVKTQIREYFARTKALIDVVFAVKPKFMGPPIVIK